MLGRLITRAAASPDNTDRSVQIDGATIRAFEVDPANPFLVSFPRTGSHWLRMLMERYFERPSLVRVFYYPERTDYLTRHVHDLELDTVRANVIYLYRDPAPTIFSQLTYHGQTDDDVEAIDHWSRLYGRHLAKWLVNENFTEKKTILRYERLKANMAIEFEKLTRHVDLPFDSARLDRAADKVSTSEVARKTGHDPKVIARAPAYAEKRQAFCQRHHARIRDAIMTVDPTLARHLDDDC